MVTGRLPFQGEYEQAVVYSILNEQPEPVTGLRTGVPLDLERMVNKCLEKDPDERYQTAGDLAADVRHVQRIRAVPSSLSRRAAPRRAAGRPGRRLWPWVAGLAVAAPLVLVLFLRSFAPNEKGAISPRKMLVILPFENLGLAEDEYFAAGMTSARFAGEAVATDPAACNASFSSWRLNLREFTS